MLPKFLPLLVGRLFQRCHLSRIDEVSKCGDFMTKPHMLSQIPSSCPYAQPLVLATVPRIKINFFPCHVQTLYSKDKIESVEWQDLAPRQRTGDCLQIHVPHWGLCDLPLSCNQTFLLVVKLRQCVLCKRLSLFWFLKQTSKFSVFQEVNEKIMYFLDATFVECSESESWEMCAGASTSAGIRLSVKSHNQKGISADGSFSSFLSLSQDSCPSFPELVFVTSPKKLNLKMSLLPLCCQMREMPLVPTVLVMVWYKTKLLSELTERGANLSVLQITLFPLLMTRGSWQLTHSCDYPWSLQSLPSDRTAGVSSSSCTVTNWIQVLNEHLCLLVRVHFTVCSQHYGWCSGPFHCPQFFWAQFFFAHHAHRCSWIDYELSLFWSLRSDRRRHTFDFIKTLELVNIFRPIPHCFAGASFLGQSFLIWSIFEFWRARTTLMRLTLVDKMPRDGPFLSRIFDLVPGVFENLTACSRPSFSWFT